LDGVRGDLSEVKGDLSGVRGDLSEVSGNLSDCNITAEKRAAGINIADLLRPLNELTRRTA